MTKEEIEEKVRLIVYSYSAEPWSYHTENGLDGFYVSRVDNPKFLIEGLVFVVQYNSVLAFEKRFLDDYLSWINNDHTTLSVLDEAPGLEFDPEDRDKWIEVLSNYNDNVYHI